MADEQAPVIVGVGTSGPPPAPGAAVEALELMVRAAEAAVADAGRPAVLDGVDWIGVPEGTWGYGDAGRLLGRRLGRPDAHTVRADVGILQQSLLDRAAAAVRGGARVALVAGGEAKHRASRAARRGEIAAEAMPATDPPDEHLRPASLGVLDLEIVRNTVAPVTAYALIEQAIGHHLGRTPAEHRRALAALWARFAAVAAGNEDAWDRSAPTADELATAVGDNRMLATPYSRRLCAQWNVDQAAALLVTTPATAAALGVPRDRWVWPHASAVSDHAVPLAARAELHRCPAAELAATALLAHAGVAADQLGPVDVYSCFPSAVELLAGALGLPLGDPDRPLTVTGGLTFAGGPLNNYVLQAMVALVERLRASPDGVGLSSSVSGFLVKQGFSLWAAHPPARPWQVLDVSGAAADATATVEVVDHHDGPGVVASATVTFAGDRAARLVALVDLPDGRRTIAEADDPAVAAAWADLDPVGRPVEVRGAELIVPG